MIKHYPLLCLLLVYLSGLLISSPSLLAQADDSAEWRRLSSILDSAAHFQEEALYQAAAELILQASPAADSIAPDSLYYRYHYLLGFNHIKLRNIHEARPAMEKALQRAAGMADSARQAAVLARLAIVSNMSQEFNKALEYLGQSEKLSPDGELDYMYYSIMALAYEGLNQFELALQYHTRARQQFVDQGDWMSQAIVENNIGELYRVHLGDREAAKEHYLRAIAINEREKQFDQLARNLHNMATLALDLQQPDSAVVYARKALDLKLAMRDSGGMTAAYYQMGVINLQRGELEAASNYFQNSLQLSEHFGIRQGVYHNHLKLGQLYLEAKRFDESRKHLFKARELADESGQLQFKHNVTYGLYLLYKEQQQYQLALEQYELLASLNDSLDAAKNSDQFNALRIQYEADLAEAENQSLREMQAYQQEALLNRNTLLFVAAIFILVLGVSAVALLRLLRQRNRANTQLRSAKQERDEQYRQLKQREEELALTNDLKNNILSVLGHDLRTPLVSISALLGTISADKISREELTELFTHLKRETDISLETLQEILVWSRLQMDESGQQLAELNPRLLLEGVIKIYEPHARAKELELQLDLEEESPLWGDKNQLRSIIGNLLSNAIKFSPPGGMIKIALRRSDYFSRLTVSDEGAGLSQRVLDNLNSRNHLITERGTRGEPGIGIGLRIVQDFVAAHRGKLIFENKPRGGARAVVLLPLKTLEDRSPKMAGQEY